MRRTIKKYLSEGREQKEVIDGKIISKDIFGRATVQTATGTFKAIDLRGMGTTGVKINNTAQNQNEFAIIAGNQERNIIQPIFYDLPLSILNQIAVIDVNNYRVQIFNKDGKYSMQFGNESMFGMIRDIVVDNEGNFYITESYPGYQVYKFDKNGEYISKKSFSNPKGITYKNDYVYIIDDNLTKCDKDLNIIKTFDVIGSFPFKLPYGVAVDSSDNFIVTSYDSHVVSSYNSSGTLNFVIGTEGEYGNNEGEFWSPRGIAIDSQDNIYVCDAFNNRIQKFDSSGNFILKFGSSGNGNGEFNLPCFVAIDDDDHIYVTDLHNHRVQIFTSSGVFIKSFGSEGNENGQFNMTMGICFLGE